MTKPVEWNRSEFRLQSGASVPEMWNKFLRTVCSPVAVQRAVPEMCRKFLRTVCAQCILLFFFLLHECTFFFSYLFITVKVWTQYTHRRISYTWCVTNQFIVDLDKSTTEGYQRKTIGAETWSNIARWEPEHHTIANEGMHFPVALRPNDIKAFGFNVVWRHMIGQINTQTRVFFFYPLGDRNILCFDWRCTPMRC